LFPFISNQNICSCFLRLAGFYQHLGLGSFSSTITDIGVANPNAQGPYNQNGNRINESINYGSGPNFAQTKGDY
jgi:hypothetical protein